MIKQRWQTLTQASRRFLGDNERGQGLAEYGLMLALIAVVCITALRSFGLSVSDQVAWQLFDNL